MDLPVKCNHQRAQKVANYDDDYRRIQKRALNVLTPLYGNRVEPVEEELGTGGVTVKPEQNAYGDVVLYHGSPVSGIKKLNNKFGNFTSVVPGYSIGYSLGRTNNFKNANMYKLIMSLADYLKMPNAGVELDFDDYDQETEENADNAMLIRAIENGVQRYFDDDEYAINYELEPVDITKDMVKQYADLEKSWTTDKTRLNLIKALHDNFRMG
jgi:hypothetical protein